MSEAVPIRHRGQLIGYLSARGDQCEAVMASGRSLGRYNTVGAAMDALRAACASVMGAPTADV